MIFRLAMTLMEVDGGTKKASDREHHWPKGILLFDRKSRTEM
ncbi:MAG: hypothetical protein ACQ5SW_13045 [Sphaerochaetaceae bacterium]